MIVLVPGHGWKGPGTCDPGAGSAASGYEADWTADLARRVAVALSPAPVALIEVGSLADRARLADWPDPRLVLHLHGDVGPPRVCHFPGSVEGRQAAVLLSEALAGVLPGGQPRVTPATVGGYPRANGLLAATRAPAVLLELVEQREPSATRWLRGHLDEVAAAIASGLRAL